jgi:hypothetical protein
MISVLQTITRAVEVLTAIADDLERVSSAPLAPETAEFEQRTAARLRKLAADLSTAASEHLPPPTA